jgi:DNA modification methylase
MGKIVKINQIKPNPKNPRTIKDERFEKLKKSIEDFPDMLNKRPLVCFTDTDGKYVVLGGNMRLKAAKDLGLKELPIILADEWTEEQKAEFLIKDNVGYGEWEWDQLKSEWDVEKLTDWGLEIPDFKVEEAEAVEDDFDVPDGGIETDIVLGDLFEIGEHRLLCGDSTDSDAVAKLMNGEKADMVFTDPPFPNNSEIMHDMIKNIDGAFNNSRLFCDKLMIWFWDNLEFPPFSEQVTSKHIWHKTNGWQAGHFETMYCYHNDEKRHEQKVYSVNNVGGENNRKEQGNHPTPKPISLIFEIINDLSKDSKSILDLFLGSGTTMVAAHQLKRKCYGMELDPKYCQVIIDRMIKLDPSLQIKKNGQPYKTGE